MSGSAMVMVGGFVTIIVLFIIFWPLNQAVQGIGDAMIAVANDPAASARIMVGEYAFDFCYFLIVLVIIIIMIRESARRPGDVQYG